MIISAIEQNKYFKKRFVIFVDGVYFSGISSLNLKRLNLTSGDACDREFLNKEIIEQEKKEAYEYMLKILELKNATEAELEKKAVRKSFCNVAVKYAKEKLLSLGLINDKSYASIYAERASRNKGKRRIAYELKMKGVSENDFSGALDNIENEFETAFLLAEKKSGQKSPSRKEKERLIRYLLYRGFSYETVKAVVNKLYGEIEYE